MEMMTQQRMALQSFVEGLLENAVPPGEIEEAVAEFIEEYAVGEEDDA